MASIAVTADERERVLDPQRAPPALELDAPYVDAPTALREGLAILVAIFVTGIAFGFLLASSLSNAIGLR